MENAKILTDPLLQKWLNPMYLKEELIQQFREFYLKNQEEMQFMQWTEFLRPEKAKTVAAQLKKGYYTQKYRPDIYKYREAQLYKSLEPFFKVLQSDALKEYINIVFGKKYKQVQLQIRCLEQGDYTLLHDMQEAYEGFLIIYDALTDWKQEYGGYEVIVRPAKDPLIMPPLTNTLAIVNCTKETRWFTKYVNSLAGGRKRYCLVGIYK